MGKLDQVSPDARNRVRDKTFKEAALPLIQWLCENMHPHSMIVVTPTSAELVESTCAFQTDEFLQD